MIRVLLAIFAVSPAAAVERVALPVAPLVVGSLGQPGHPLAPRLEARARELTHARGVLPLLEPSRPVADRLSGYALARMIVEPGTLDAALALRPELARTPVARLPNLLTPASPYRGGVAPELARVVEAAETGRGLEAVSALFDGRASQARLDEAGLDGRALRLSGRKAAWLSSVDGGRIYAHPDLPGAAIEVLDRPLRADETPFEPLPWREAALERLAARGLAPRTFGRDVLFAKGLGPTPMRAATIRERVQGRTLSGVLGDRPLTAEERAGVLRILEAVAEDGGALYSIKPEHIVLGQTVLRPEPSAYLADGAGLSAAFIPPRLRARLAQDWLARLENAAIVWRAKANSGLAGFRF